MLKKLIAMLGAGSAGASSVWLMLERVLRMLSGIFIAALVARSLGPERFGEMTFALQCLAFATPFATLGLHNMTIKWLVREGEGNADCAAEIVGQTLLVRLLLATVLVGVALLIGVWIGWSNEVLYILLGLSSLLPHAFLAVQRYFLSFQRGDLIFAASLVAILIVGALRIWFAFSAPSVAAFLILYFAEQLIMGVALLAFYLHLPDGPGLRSGDATKALERIYVSLPLLPTVLAGTLFATMDFFMLRMWSTPEQLGIYGAAMRVTGAWVVLQAAVIDGVSARIVQESDPRDTSASEGLLQVYEIVTLLSLGMIVTVSILSEQIALVLYGSAYSGVGSVMVLHIWAALFLGWRAISAQWLIADGTLWLALRRHLPGIAITFVVGPMLVPHFGAMGAATAMLCGAITSGFLFDFISSKTRKHGMAKLKALQFSGLRHHFFSAWNKN